jgi:hypothetical protein
VRVSNRPRGQTPLRHLRVHLLDVEGRHGGNAERAQGGPDVSRKQALIFVSGSCANAGASRICEPMIEVLAD